MVTFELIVIDAYARKFGMTYQQVYKDFLSYELFGDLQREYVIFHSQDPRTVAESLEKRKLLRIEYQEELGFPPRIGAAETELIELVPEIEPNDVYRIDDMVVALKDLLAIKGNHIPHKVASACALATALTGTPPARISKNIDYAGLAEERADEVRALIASFVKSREMTDVSIRCWMRATFQWEMLPAFARPNNYGEILRAAEWAKIEVA